MKNMREISVAILWTSGNVSTDITSFVSFTSIIYGYFRKHLKASNQFHLRSIFFFDTSWVGPVPIEEKIERFVNFLNSANFGIPDQLVIRPSKYWEIKYRQFHNKLVMAAFHLFLDLEYSRCSSLGRTKKVQHASCNHFYRHDSLRNRLECHRN